VDVARAIVTPLSFTAFPAEPSPLHLAAGFNKMCVQVLCVLALAHVTACRPIVTLFLDVKADPNKADKDGLVPLHNAAAYGHEAMCRLLLSRGANVNAQDKWGFTPLHEAASRSRPAVCRYLVLMGADPRIQNSEKKTAIDLADDGGAITIRSFVSYARIHVSARNSHAP
jgi:ankyrin repeat protein